MRLLQGFLLALILALPMSAQADETPADARDPSPAAVAFVSQFSDAHLTGILQRMGTRQPTLVAMSELHGQLLAAVYDVQVAKALEKHGPAWQHNLALAWTPLLTDEEFDSLRVEAAASPHAEKYREKSPEAGQRMQGLSEELLREIFAEVLQGTIAELTEPAETDGDGEKKSE